MLNKRKKEIENIAYGFRNHCNLNKYGIIDLFKDCQKLGYYVIRFPLDDTNSLGFTIKRYDDTIIYTNSGVRMSREIFTLAHEIGHVQLHNNFECPFVDNSRNISGFNIEEREVEANYFAACLLLPEKEVRNFLNTEILDFSIANISALDIARIMLEFNVSFELILNRLVNIGLINSKTRVALDTEKKLNHVDRLLKNAGGNSKLNIVSNDIVIPLEYLYYIIFNFNHKAVPIETLNRALAYYHIAFEDISDKINQDIEDEDYDLDELIERIQN